MKPIEQMRQAMFDHIAEQIKTMKEMNPKQMRKVITIPELVEKSDKPVEFTHDLYGKDSRWGRTIDTPNDYDKVVYLGFCDIDGDMFAAYDGGCIEIFKGNLNSGEY